MTIYLMQESVVSNEMALGNTVIACSSTVLPPIPDLGIN